MREDTDTLADRPWTHVGPPAHPHTRTHARTHTRTPVRRLTGPQASPLRHDTRAHVSSLRADRQGKSHTSTAHTCTHQTSSSPTPQPSTPRRPPTSAGGTGPPPTWGTDPLTTVDHRSAPGRCRTQRSVCHQSPGCPPRHSPVPVPSEDRQGLVPESTESRRREVAVGGSDHPRSRVGQGLGDWAHPTGPTTAGPGTDSV